jgi:Rod binding domain-containing protein
MTALNPLAQANAAIQHQAGNDPNQKLQAAARQFEGVMLTQLLQVLWKTTPELNKGQGSMYQSMFQSQFADHLVEGGGIGLSQMIAKSLGATEESSAAHLTRHSHALPQVLRGYNVAPQALDDSGDVMANVSGAASGMISGGGQQWAKSGSLTAEDFGSVGASAQAGANARRTIESANGYQGYYKCNLFAFELARRAGLDVPKELPSSNNLTQDASDGGLETGWAKVATGASPAAMQDALHAGEAALLLVGSGHGERHGHMAVLEKPTAIDYDEAGQIRSISFEGWEAQPDGAKHLTNRTWNRFGEKGAPGDRNGLDRIEIIQLSRKDAHRHAPTTTPLQSR